MNKIDPVEFNINYRLFIDGRISEDKWQKYCSEVLDKLLEINKDVLIRLKDRF